MCIIYDGGVKLRVLVLDSMWMMKNSSARFFVEFCRVEGPRVFVSRFLDKFADNEKVKCPSEFG